jgi:hypothetical protein
LHHVNQFTPLPLPCPALPRAWNWSCRWYSGLVIWAVYIVKIRFRTGCTIVSANTQAQPKGSILAPYVTLVMLVVHSCIFKIQRYISITTKPTQSIRIYFVSKLFHDCMIFNFVV